MSPVATEIEFAWVGHAPPMRSPQSTPEITPRARTLTSFRQYPGDASINKLAYDSGYDIPRDKSTASLTWKVEQLSWTLSGTRLGKLPNYDQDAYIKASYLFNTSLQYDFTDHLRGSLTVNNVLDTNPVKDRSYASYPYYDISWFDSVGRSIYLEMTWKIGGSGL